MLVLSSAEWLFSHRGKDIAPCLGSDRPNANLGPGPASARLVRNSIPSEMTLQSEVRVKSRFPIMLERGGASRISMTARRRSFVDIPGGDYVTLLTSDAPRPCIAIVDGNLSSLSGIGKLRAPGFYIGKWSIKSEDGRTLGYVGQSACDVVRRIQGSVRFRQPTPVAALAIVTSQEAFLTPDDVAALERIAHRSINAFSDVTLVSADPAGQAVGLDRYRCLRAFWNETALCLEENGFLFGRPGDLPRVLRADELFPHSPTRVLHTENLFKHEALGVRAFIQVCSDSCVVLAGSEIRSDVVRSTSEVPKVLREEFLYAGVLIPSARPDALLLTRDVRLMSQTAASIFVLGSRGAGPNKWCATTWADVAAAEASMLIRVRMFDSVWRAPS